MTARAATWEHTCSSCRALVLRAELETIAEQPRCSSCGFLVCDACELFGRCPRCVEGDLAAVDELATLVVVEGVSEIGARPWFATQPSDGSVR